MTDGAELIAGRYRLISQVGSGAMGVVWRAHDERLGRTVAVKQLRAPIGLSSTQIEQAQRRAQREARIAARLQHPNAVCLYDVVEHDGRPCLVMEYVDAATLSEVLADGNTLSPAEVASIGAQLASALVAAHAAGIVHRDIKPANILMSESGAVKLTDFGISRATGDVTVTATGEMLGTPAFTSPEVAQGRAAGSPSDVFSLGATLYAALEGTPPFGTGPTAMALLLRIVNGEMRRPEHSGALVNTLLWMMRPNPADRPTMAQVQHELESVTAETLVVLPVPEHQEQDAVPDATSAAAADAPASDAAAEAAAASSSSDGGGSSEPTHVATPVPTPDAALPSPAAPTPAAAPTTTTPPEPKPGKRSRLLPAALLLVAAVITAGIVAALTASHGPGGPSSASSPTNTASKSAVAASSRPATSAAPGSRTSASKTASASASASTSASTSPSTSASMTTTASLSQQLSSAITQYYQLVPGNLNAAWNYLTTDYQQNHAGGMSGYQSFWDQIQSVSLSDVVAQPPGTVLATIDYSYKGGKRVRERTSFGLVNQGGLWKIASSSVLSSTSS